MLSTSRDILLKLSKTKSSQKLFLSDCITLYTFFNVHFYFETFFMTGCCNALYGLILSCVNKHFPQLAGKCQTMRDDDKPQIDLI